MAGELLGVKTGRRMLEQADNFLLRYLEKYGEVENIPEHLLKAVEDLRIKGNIQIEKFTKEQTVQQEKEKKIIIQSNSTPSTTSSTPKKELNNCVKFHLKPFFKSKKRLARIAEDSSGVWWTNEARDLRDVGGWKIIGSYDELLQYKKDAEDITDIKLKFVGVNRFGLETNEEIV